MLDHLNQEIFAIKYEEVFLRIIFIFTNNLNLKLQQEFCDTGLVSMEFNYNF